MKLELKLPTIPPGAEISKAELGISGLSVYDLRHTLAMAAHMPSVGSTVAVAVAGSSGFAPARLSPVSGIPFGTPTQW
eukprot:6171915-Pleurochrysis_carterae.AAC.7